MRFFGWIIRSDFALQAPSVFGADAVHTKYGSYILIRRIDARPMSRLKNPKICQTARNVEKSEVSEGRLLSIYISVAHRKGIENGLLGP